jgi:hypothetical protein
MSFDPETRVEQLIAEIEQDCCACSFTTRAAGYCPVHKLCELLREAVRESQSIYRG